MNKAKIFLDKKQEAHKAKFGVYADVNSKIAEWMQEYANTMKNKTISNDALLSIFNQEISDLTSEAVWYLNEYIGAKLLARIYYTFRFERVTKRRNALISATKYFKT